MFFYVRFGVDILQHGVTGCNVFVLGLRLELHYVGLLSERSRAE